MVLAIFSLVKQKLFAVPYMFYMWSEVLDLVIPVFIVRQVPIDCAHRHYFLSDRMLCLFSSVPDILFGQLVYS